MKKTTTHPLRTRAEKRQLRNILCIFAGVILLGVMLFLKFYSGYIDDVLHAERQTQLQEVTDQLFHGVEDLAQFEWTAAEFQCSTLEMAQPATQEELAVCLQRQSAMDERSAVQDEVLAVDEQGNWYTGRGLQGTLSDIGPIRRKETQFSFVERTGKARTVFLHRLAQPMDLADGSRLVYVGITRRMETLNRHFRCSAYDGHNSVYVLNAKGGKLFYSGDRDLLEGGNAYQALRGMVYRHGSSFASTWRQLKETGVAYSNVMLDGKEYYCVLYQMESIPWTLLFLVPARYVAVNTVAMVDTTVRLLLAFAVALVAVSGWAIVTLFNRKQRQAVDAERRNSEALAAVNGELDRKNTELVHAVQTEEAAKRQAEAAKQEAETANQAKSDFLASMSHDIRTPMNAIVGITSLMRHEPGLSDRMEDYLKKIDFSSRHLLSLINDILDMSKIESGEVKLGQEPVSLAEQIGQVDSIIRAQTNERQQTFSVRVRRVAHERLLGDQTRLRQILLNLLSNATKYTPNGGSILFELTEESCLRPGCAAFSFTVTDTGYGMEAEFVKHIFEPFTRAESSMTSKVQGTGLGMAITKRLVDLMGGTIRVDSTPGRGSRFQVDLTLQIDQSAASPLTGETVLLLTREEALREAVRTPLQAADIALLTAADADQAAPLLEREHPQVVLLGGALDDGTLEAAAARLRKLAPDAAWVLCVDHSQREQAETLAHRGVVDSILPRPFFLTNLEQAVRQTRSTPDGGEEVSYLQGMHFLCAEDNELNAEILRALLELHGAGCTIYHDGEEIVRAFQTVRAGAYDAILMDVQMPRMNGYEATHAIRSGENPLGKTIPILAMTANAFADDVQRSLASGMNGHISKPLDVAVLEKTLRDLGVQGSDSL